MASRYMAVVLVHADRLRHRINHTRLGQRTLMWVDRRNLARRSLNSKGSTGTGLLVEAVLAGRVLVVLSRQDMDRKAICTLNKARMMLAFTTKIKAGGIGSSGWRCRR